MTVFEDAGRLAFDDRFVYIAFTRVQGGGVVSVPKRGGELKYIATGGVGDTWDVASYGGDVYWSYRYGRYGAISHQDATGYQRQLVGGISPIAIAADGQSVYWSGYSTDGEISRIDKDGTHLTVLAPPNTEGHPAGLAVDDARAYWTRLGIPPAEGRVLGAPKGGGDMTTYAASGAVRSGPMPDKSAVYWINGGIARACVDGSLPEQFVDEFVGFAAADERWVYWTGSTAVRRRAKSGGDSETLADSAATPTGVAVDADCVYWWEIPKGVLMQGPKTPSKP